MKKIIRLTLIFILLISCKDSKKTDTIKKSKFDDKATQTEFKKVESQNSLNLEYQLLDENNEQINFMSLKKMPEFPGGLDSLTVFIQKNFEFKQGFVENVEGKVRATFIVDTIGKVVDIEIIKGFNNHIDKSCSEVISKLPDWKPAELSKGKKVKVKFLLPFRFKSE